MNTEKLIHLGHTGSTDGFSLSRKHPVRYAPKGGWKEHTFYIVEVAFSNNNPVHRHILYTGFLSENGTPSGYNKLITSSDNSVFSDAVYLHPVERLFSKQEKKLGLG